MGKQLPTAEDCTKLMEHYEMLPNIREHSLIVASVAATLFTALEKNIAEKLPDRELVIKGAMLHDIAKTICLHGKCMHDVMGEKICLDHGYPDLAEIVKEHVYLEQYPERSWMDGIFQAKEIVFYADKRVNHDQLVSLSERLSYILKTYGQKNKKREQFIMNNFFKCKKLENALFSFIDFSPEILSSEPGDQFLSNLRAAEIIHHNVLTKK